MKIFILIFGLFLFSCTQVRYLSKPIYQFPCIGMENDKRILIAKDNSIKTKKIESDKCFDGMISNIEGYKPLKIVEIIDFDKKVDSIILLQLKDKYDIAGLLLLTDIYEQPFNKLKEEFSQACVGCPTNYSLEYENHVTSIWEYFDFITGKTFGYTIENNKTGKWKYNLNNPEDINNIILQIKEQMLFENGQICINKLIGP